MLVNIPFTKSLNQNLQTQWIKKMKIDNLNYKQRHNLAHAINYGPTSIHGTAITLFLRLGIFKKQGEEVIILDEVKKAWKEYVKAAELAAIRKSLQDQNKLQGLVVG